MLDLSWIYTPTQQQWQMKVKGIPYKNVKMYTLEY